MSRFRAETGVFDCLRSLVEENVILERFGIITDRSTFDVRFFWMSRFPGETPVFDLVGSVVRKNVILERLRVISERSTFHVRFC